MRRRSLIRQVIGVARALAIAAVMLVGACGTDPMFSDFGRYLPEVPKDEARLVFFRQARFVGALMSADITIDGEAVGSLSNGAMMLLDRAPGTAEIVVHRPFDARDTAFALGLEPGITYYVEIGTPGAGGVLFGSLSADVRQYCGGGWCAALESRDEAAPKLGALWLQKTAVQRAAAGR